MGDGIPALLVAMFSGLPGVDAIMRHRAQAAHLSPTDSTRS